MIVKIQRSQAPSRAGKVSIYNRSFDYRWEGKPDRAVDKWMGGRQKVFAYARLEGTEFIIDGEAPWQDW